MSVANFFKDVRKWIVLPFARDFQHLQVAILNKRDNTYEEMRDAALFRETYEDTFFTFNYDDDIIGETRNKVAFEAAEKLRGATDIKLFPGVAFERKMFLKIEGNDLVYLVCELKDSPDDDDPRVALEKYKSVQDMVRRGYVFESDHVMIAPKDIAQKEKVAKMLITTPIPDAPWSSPDTVCSWFFNQKRSDGRERWIVLPFSKTIPFLKVAIVNEASRAPFEEVTKSTLFKSLDSNEFYGYSDQAASWIYKGMVPHLFEDAFSERRSFLRPVGGSDVYLVCELSSSPNAPKAAIDFEIVRKMVNQRVLFPLPDNRDIVKRALTEQELQEEIRLDILRNR